MKVDSSYGSDSERNIRGLCKSDSGSTLLETISQLQFDRQRQPDNNGTLRTRNRPDVPGWFYTSTADEVYYFIAILNTAAELRPVYSDYVELVRTRKPTLAVEEKLLKSLRIDRDLLIAYELNRARTWYENASPDAFAGYAGAVNPTYITLSRRAHRDRFVREAHARNHGSIFNELMS